MSTYIPPEVVPVIRDAIARHPAGATIKDILEAFAEPPTRRTLQRWLSGLVDIGQLGTKPNAFPTRYLLLSPAAAAEVGHGQLGSVANLRGQVPPPAAAPEVGHGQPADPAANPAAPGHGQPPAVANPSPALGHAGPIPAPVANSPTPLGHGQLAPLADVRGQVPPPAAAPEVGHGQPDNPVANRTPLGHGQPPAVANPGPALGHAGPIPAPVANSPTPLGHGQPPAVANPGPALGHAGPIPGSVANSPTPVGHGQPADPVANRTAPGHGQPPAVANPDPSLGHAGPIPAPVANSPTPLGHGQPPAVANPGPALGHAGPIPAPVANSPTPVGHGQPADPVANRTAPGHGQPPAVANPDPSLGHGHTTPAPAGHPKPHRRKATGHPSADPTAAEPADAAAGSVEATVASVGTELLNRLLRPRPKSGSPVRKRHRPTLPLVISTAVAASLLAWLGHLTWNVWTLSGAAVLAAIGAAVLAWESRQGYADSAPGSATPLPPVLRRLGGGGSGWAAWAAGGLGLVALVAAVLAYRQFRLRPTIGTVQAFVTSRLAPLPGRVIALDVTFQAPGKAGVRLTYRAAIENTAPLYQTVATLSYLDNQPGHPLAALTSADLRLEGAAGDKVRATVGPAPTPDPRHVILLKPAVPIGTTAVASGTLVAWRTDNGWKFTIEQETPPRFAGEPRPTEKPTYVLDAPADAAAYASVINNAVAYAAKVKDAANRTASSSAEPAKPTSGSSSAGLTEDRRQTSAPTADTNPVSREEPKQQPAKDEPGRATDSAPRLAQSTAAPLPGQQTADDGGQPGQVAPAVPPAGPTSAIRPPPSDSTPASALRPPSSGSIPPSALRPLPSGSDPTLPSGPGAYALIDGAWASLPRANRQKVQSAPQALTMKLQSLTYAEDAAAGRTSKPPTDPVANVILTGADDLPTAPAGELVLVYVGELKLPSAALMAKYPALKTYPEIELAPVQLAGGTTRYIPLYLVAPGALAYGPGRVPATLEHPGKNTIVLRAQNLTPGTYALACGSSYYEVNVR